MKIRFEKQMDEPGIGIRGISIVDEEHVWLCGSRGWAARTENGGGLWRTLRPAGYEALDFRSIHAFDERRALLMNAGSPATILSTDDQGRSWKKVHHDQSGVEFLDAMVFRNELEGFCLGDPVDGKCFLLETENGGLGWKRADPALLPAPEQGESHFAASSSCIALFGEEGLCFVSGGSVCRFFLRASGSGQWVCRALPLMSGVPSQGAFSIAVLDGARACVVGGDYARPGLAENTVALTEDGGLGWSRADVFPEGGYCSSVAYVPGRKGRLVMAAGSQGSHLSDDGGKSWTRIDKEPWNLLGFAPSGRGGWIAGPEGRVARIFIED